MDIKVNVRQSEGDAYVVELAGEIDVYTSPKVKDAITELIDQGHYNLVINLEKVRYIDSTGLGVLIGGLKRVREHGGSVSLVCTNPQIKKIFDITGLVKIFGIFDTEQRCDEGPGVSSSINMPIATTGVSSNCVSRARRNGSRSRVSQLPRSRSRSAVLGRRDRRSQTRCRGGLHDGDPARRRRRTIEIISEVFER